MSNPRSAASRLSSLSRRQLGASVAAAAAAAASVTLTGCADSSAETPPTALASGTKLGVVADFAPDSARVVKVDGHEVVVARSAEGDFSACSAVCPHKGCTVFVTPTELECPCHGSRFVTGSGELINGPAATPLPPLDVTISGDAVVVE